MQTFLRITRPLIVLLTLAMLLLAPGGLTAQGTGARIFLPLLPNQLPPTVFGIEMASITAERGLELATASGVGWIRRNSLLWRVVEPVEGAGYRWDDPLVQQLETELIAAAERGIRVILIIRSSPLWAVAPHTQGCRPINPAKYQAFGRFLAAAVERYSQPPYNVHYWEIFNEPDSTPRPTERMFGCWGQDGEPFFGGEAYGEMMKVAAPAMRAANPTIQILSGGLQILEPYNPNTVNGRMTRFMEGVLRAGAGHTFDILSFHAYDVYTTGPAPLGERVDWRVAYLRDLLRRYNVPPKPLIRTEAALLCPGTVSAECRWAQADYVGRIYARTLRDGLLGTVWYIYDNDSHHNAALIDPGDVWVPRPAYFAYRHAATMMSQATYLGPLSGVPPSVEGYRLARPGDTLTVLWSDTPQSVRVAVPAQATVGCTDRDGGAITCRNLGGVVQIDIGQGPTYLVYR